MARHRAPRQHRRVLAPAAVAVLGAGAVLAAVPVVWQDSTAAFSATSGNAGNGWSSGSVVLGDDDTGTALFTAAGLVPGSTDQRCIAVQYTGTLAATVKLYASSTSGTLAPYLDLTVEEGSGGGYGSCTGFTPATTLSTGTLAAFGAARTGFGTGVGTFAPSGTATKVYRFTYQVQFATPDSAAGTSATAAFTWEAQNT
ncbi:hypothetical protein [Dactylosporangium sp. CS-033363]|uniref:hypothetical protein n=1 Tax=Dactylosporangium sp. CS-033363 TaxID=3239935 RepID=UPI003D8D8B77